MSAVIIEAAGAPRRRLWYAAPSAHSEDVPSDADHLVIGCVFLLMQTGSSALVHGQVSPSLLRNLIEYQSAWASVVPGLTCVEICAEQEREATRRVNRKGALVAFSGGVDSCFTAYRHRRGAGLRLPREIDGAVMVHGFDLPLDDPITFHAAAERARTITSSLGLELITVATNYREIVADWPKSHGAAVASCLALLGAGFREGLIGQTFTYEEIRHVVEGVNALTDPLMSSDSFRIVPDGAAFERADKIRELGAWQEFRANLRVCWEAQREHNCCRCEKCIRNILTFRALGLGLPSCFEHDVSAEQIRSMKLGDPTRAGIRYGSIARLARESGADGPWVEALASKIAADRRALEQRRAIRRLRSYPRRARARLMRLLGVPRVKAPNP